MNIAYYLVDPTKNYTIIAETPVPTEDQPGVAARLMELEPLAEQVGFITEECEGSVTLRMAGGEFCGNAAMSAALVHTLKNPDCKTVKVRFLGADLSVNVRIGRDSGGKTFGTVEMPEPLSAERIPFPFGGELPAVFFPGITHVISERPMERAEAEELAPIWCGYLGAEALGIMFYDRELNRMTPLVYVHPADTMFWENSCASGTAALGYYLRQEKGTAIRAEIAQPGGVLKLAAEASGPLRLTGSVSIVHKREAVI